MSRLTRSLLFFSLLAVGVGCTETAGVMTLVTRIGGRVVHAETAAPLSGVVVKICNYEVSATTDSDGHWFIEITPGLEGDDIYLTFERTGYAATGHFLRIDPDSDLEIENRDFEDDGTTSMRPGASITVQITRDGAPFGGAFAFVTTYEFSYRGTPCTDLNILGTANTAGIVTFANLNPDVYYRLVVPAQDTNGDNIPDTWDESDQIHIGQYGSTYAIDVRTRMPDPFPDITGTNLAWYDESFSLPTGPIDGDASRSTSSYGWAALDQRFSFLNEHISFSEAVITPNHSVQVVFWTPVDVLQPRFTYRNNLVGTSDPDFDETLEISGTATALAGSNFTIYNFTPATLLPSNEYVTLRFLARSRVNNANTNNLEVRFYVPLALPSYTVAADNFNGSRDGSGSANYVNLRFLEAVEGWYKVLSYQIDGSTVTFDDPFEWSFNFDSFDQIVYNEEAAPATGANIGQSGAVAGKQYTFRIRDEFGSYVFLNDDVPAGPTVNRVRVEVSVRNILGVRLDGIFDLPVE